MIHARSRSASRYETRPRFGVTTVALTWVFAAGVVGCIRRNTEGSSTEAILGKDDSVVVSRQSKSFPPFIKNAIDAVGVLQKIGAPIGFCTVFYIGHNLAVTAGHCFARSSQAIKAGTPCTDLQIKFGYLKESPGGSHISNCKQVEFNDYKYYRKIGLVVDYTIFTIDNPPNQSVTVDSKTLAKRGHEIMILGHPLAQPMKLSSCTVPWLGYDPFLTGLVPHRCDTEPGTSGAPVFDSRSGAVIGIHVQGKSDAQFYNAFVPLRFVSHISNIPK
jgi:V8-like Glu-specific endopeptidase